MKFPDLIKDEDFVQAYKNGGKLYRYKLDWTKLETYKKEEKIAWYKNHHTDFLTDYQKKIFFDKVISNLDWDNWLRPTKYQYIFDKFEYVYMPESYYNEMKHFEDLALKEWSRKRGFDTSVRDKCLEVAEKSVSLYFYMLMDGLYMYSGTYIDCEPTFEDKRDFNMNRCREQDMFKVLNKYIFWKSQTGGGLVIDRAFNDTHETIMKLPFMIQLEKDLEDNNSTSVLGCGWSDQKEAMLKLIKEHERENQINKLLNDK